jgi:DNA-binding transcriptional ArsR family regulator
VTELAAPFQISLPAVSKHLRILANARLLTRKKYGRIQICCLEAGPLQNATAWLARYQRPLAPKLAHSFPQFKATQNLKGVAGKMPPAIFPLTTNLSPIIFNRSVKLKTRVLDVTFSALADPTRRAILICLAFTDSSVTELAAPFNISLPALSKHLRVLEAASLIIREKQGRINLCRLVAAPLEDAATWINRYQAFWEKQLDALAKYLDEDKKE